jgi:DNA-binding PadR family transcriptional regulator
VANRLRSSRDLLALTILALLTEQPRHPYEVQQQIRERHKDFAKGKPRALYHAVDQLVQAGAIEPVETNREGKRPERTVYRITDEGREEFFGWLRDLLENPASEYPAFTAAVSFLGYLPSETVVQALQGRIVALTSEIAALDSALRVLLDRWRMPRLWVIEHEFTRAIRQAELEWVQSLLEDLQSGRLTWDYSKEQ